MSRNPNFQALVQTPDSLDSYKSAVSRQNWVDIYGASQSRKSVLTGHRFTQE